MRNQMKYVNKHLKISSLKKSLSYLISNGINSLLCRIFLSISLVLSLVAGSLTAGFVDTAWAAHNQSDTKSIQESLEILETNIQGSFKANESVSSEIDETSGIDTGEVFDSDEGEKLTLESGTGSSEGLGENTQSSESGASSWEIEKLTPESNHSVAEEESIVELGDSPTPFGIIGQGTWQGVDWKLTNDKAGYTDYELQFGNPDGVTVQTFSAGANLWSGPWNANATEKQYIREINIVGPVIAPTNLAWAFKEMTALRYWNDHSANPNIPYWDTSNTTNFESMFEGCRNLSEIDVTGWDTSNATLLIGIFRGCLGLRSIEGLSTWDVSKVMGFALMFYECRNLTTLEITGWNINNNVYINMSSMFASCSKLVEFDTSTWTTTNSGYNGSYWSGMFDGCTQLVRLDLSGIVTDGTENPTQHMLRGCTKLRILTVGVNVAFGTQFGLPTPPYPESTGKWQTIGTSSDYKWPNGNWTGSSLELAYRTRSVRATDTYVWQPPLGFAEVPEIFDFGKHTPASGVNDLGLSASVYTPAETVNGFNLTVGSNALYPWHVTAELGNFTNLDGGTIPSGVQLQISGMTLNRVDGPPAVGANPSLPSTQMTLTAGSVPVKIISATNNAGGIGEWAINMPFNNIRLQVPRLNQNDMGQWETVITWSLDNTP